MTRGIAFHPDKRLIDNHFRAYRTFSVHCSWSPNLDTDHMQRHDQAMQEGGTGNAVKKGHNRGTGIKAVLVQAPRLQGAARYVGTLAA